MTDQESFLHAIRKAPDDDTPRVVFADWLDEHGEGERAEFIRKQIELYRMPGRMPGHLRSDARCDEVRGWLNRYITGGYPLRWLGIEPSEGWYWGGLEYEARVGSRRMELVVVRGFVEEVCCPWRVWAERSEDVLATHPTLRAVRLTSAVEWEVAWGATGRDGARFWLEGEPSDPHLFTRYEVLSVCPPGERIDEALLLLRWPGPRFPSPPDGHRQNGWEV